MTSVAGDVGEDYKAADESPTIVPPALASADPDLLAEGLRQHALVQNLLATHVSKWGAIPRSPGAQDPQFDLAFSTQDGTLFVVECKSLTAANETSQIRIGIGQVLDYAHRMSARPLLMLSRRPTSDHWLDLAANNGISLVWPSLLIRLREEDDLLRKFGAR